MITWHFTVTEYNVEKPWLVVSTRRGMRVELEDEIPFADWAHDKWPSPRFSVELEPWQLSRNLGIRR